jgi:protein deglycase
MKRVFLFLAEGFEETEAIGTVDVLRRAGIDAETVSISNSLDVTGAHGIKIHADQLLKEADIRIPDALILPGGMPGAKNLKECEPLKELLLDQYRSDRIVAAICAAPMVLGTMGLLKGHRATCYPGFEDFLIGAKVTGKATETDGNVITGKGPGFVFDFALAIVTAVRGKAVAEEVAAGMLL